MNKINYERGDKIGNFIYLKDVTRTGIARRALFRCHCGKEFERDINNANKKSSKSCGCTWKESMIEANTKHGFGGTKKYDMWFRMISRCHKPHDPSYTTYGAKGIKVYNEWRNDIKSYIDYVSNLDNAFKLGYTIDRIKNKEGYKPGNLKWSTTHEQNTNQNIRKDNKTGYKGVIIYKPTGKFVSKIRVDYVSKHIGTFDNPHDAVIARNNYIIENNLNEYEIQIVKR